MKNIDWEKVVLIAIAAGGIGCALYWRYRYNKAVNEGAVWIFQAIQKMEDQKKRIEELTMEAATI